VTTLWCIAGAPEGDQLLNTPRPSWQRWISLAVFRCLLFEGRQRRPPRTPASALKVASVGPRTPTRLAGALRIAPPHSHGCRLTVQSSPPEARNFPSGEKTTLLTASSSESSLIGEFDSGDVGWSQNLCAGGNVTVPQQKRKKGAILCLLTQISPVRIDGVGP
jgi:hypothetical protein